MFQFEMELLQGWVQCSMCVLILECKYCKVRSHVQCVFWFWNGNIARLGDPMSNVCFGFEMQVLQGWVPNLVCV